MNETATIQGQTIDEHLQPEVLNAYADGELGGNELRKARRHIEGCHECTLRVLSVMRLKAATARAREDFAAPPETLARLAASLRPQEKKRNSEGRRWWMFAWPALAACVLVVGALMAWRAMTPRGNLQAELVDQHLATLASGASPEVISTDQHTVKPWFQGRLPFSFNLPGDLPAGTVLKGADVTYVDGRPAALLLFTVGKHEVSVFVMQRNGRADAESKSVRSGFTVQAAMTRELEIVAVSNVNPAELSALVESVAKAQAE